MRDEANPLSEDLRAALLAAHDDALAGAAGPPGDIPDDLHGCLPLLRRLRQLGDAGEATQPAAPPGPPAPRRIGPYEIGVELGRGGFGVVYRAHDPRVGRDVALKVPHPHVLASPELRRRFFLEARAAAALDHPNVVPLHECGEAGADCFLVSAFCPGPMLFAWLRSRTEPVPPRDAALLLRQLADGVGHAHERGVVHRGLKPANVLLSDTTYTTYESSKTYAGVPKIADFGLAKFLDAAAGGPADAETQTGAILGTPSYMSPEQALGGRSAVGPATDIYSLGAVLYEVLTGRPPFVGDSVLVTLMQVRLIEPVPVRRLRPTVPRDLETICHKCLRKEASKRYATAKALAEDLSRFLDGRPILARPAGYAERVWRAARRKPLVAALAAALVLAFALGFAGVLWQWRRAEKNAEQALWERDQAKANFDQARQVVDQLSKLGERLLSQPGQSKTGREVVVATLAYYQKFLEQKSDDPKVRW